MPTVDPKTRHAVFKRDRYQCQYCFDDLKYAQATVDHKVPRSRNGPDTPDNLVTACKRCNTVKADVPFDVFMAIREEVGGIWYEDQVFGEVLRLYQEWDGEQRERDRWRSEPHPEWDAVLAGCWA